MQLLQTVSTAAQAQGSVQTSIDARATFAPPPEAVLLARAQTQPGFMPIIRTWQDFVLWTTPEQWKVFDLLHNRNPSKMHEIPGYTSWVPHWTDPFTKSYRDLKDEMKAGRARIPLADILAYVGQAYVSAGYAYKSEDWLDRNIRTPVTLEDANMDFASISIAKAMNSNRAEVVTAAQAYGIRTDISDNDMGGALVYQIATAATSQGLTVPQVVEFYGDLQVQGAGSMLSEFWNKTKDWFNEAVVKNIGRALKWVGTKILEARDNIPYLGTFFLDPLGISLIAEGLKQVGEFFRTGDAAHSFNERVLGFELGRHWTALGQALIVAGGIISSSGIGLPLGALITAIGVVLYAAGATITAEMRAREAASRARKGDKELEAMKKKVAAECREELEAAGVAPEQIPKDADACVKFYSEFHEEILYETHSTTRKDSKPVGLLLTLLGVGYLLTRR